MRSPGGKCKEERLRWNKAPPMELPFYREETENSQIDVMGAM